MSMHLATRRLEAQVLTACRKMLARGEYPSLQRIADAVGLDRRNGTIHKCRARLMARGDLAFDLRNSGAAGMPPAECKKPDGLNGRTPEELAEAEARALQVQVERSAAVTLRRCLPVLNPGPYRLDDLTHRAACRVIRRKFRRLFPVARRSHAQEVSPCNR